MIWFITNLIAISFSMTALIILLYTQINYSHNQAMIIGLSVLVGFCVIVLLIFTGVLINHISGRRKINFE